MNCSSVRPRRSIGGIAVAVFCAALALGIVSVPNSAEADVCFGTGLMIPAAGVAGTALVGIPALTAPHKELDIALGGGTGGMEVDTTLTGDWGEGGYQVDMRVVEPGAVCPTALWGNLSASFAWDHIDDRTQRLRTFYGAGAFASLRATGPNLQVGVRYERNVSRAFAVGGSVRYLPSIATGGEPEGLDRPVMHPVRGSGRIRWRAMPEFQPFLRGVVGTVDPALVGRRADIPLGLYGNVLLGVRGRWPTGSRE